MRTCSTLMTTTPSVNTNRGVLRNRHCLSTTLINISPLMFRAFTTMNSRIVMSLLCAFAVVLPGCGDGRPSLVVATGTVTLNGEPLEGATVGFQPMDIEGYERPSQATTDSTGSFVVGTFGSGDGIPEGSYRVTVKKTEIVGKLPDDFNPEEPNSEDAKPVKMRSIVPMMYGEPEESELTVTVTAGGLSPSTIALEGEAEMQFSGRREDDP
jgi:hypothetical protein